MKYEKAISLEEFEAYLKKKKRNDGKRVLKNNTISSYMSNFKKLLDEWGAESDEIAENIDVLMDEYNTGGKYEHENLKSRGTYHAVLKKFKDFLQELETEEQTNLRDVRLQNNKDNVLTEETKICPYCAEIIKKVAKKCRYCGEWFEERPLVEARQTEKEIDKNEQTEKYDFLKDKRSDSYVNMKVGEIARKRLMPLLDEKTIPENVLKYLQSKDYSKQYLNIDYPLLQEISSFLEKRHKRYYKLPIKINGKLFRLCNDWYERDRENLIDFIEDFKIQYGD